MPRHQCRITSLEAVVVRHEDLRLCTHTAFFGTSQNLFFKNILQLNQSVMSYIFEVSGILRGSLLSN